MSIALVDSSRVEPVLGRYGVAAATALVDPLLHTRTQDYRRQVSSRMAALDKAAVGGKMPKAEYHVSRKIDGEFTALLFADGKAATVNPGGTVRVGLPVLDEAARTLASAGLKKAMIACELFVDTPGRRARVHDVCQVARQPATEADLARLHLAAFDILDLGGAELPSNTPQLRKQLAMLFGQGERLRPVLSEVAADTKAVLELFDRWVEQTGDEGLVARSDDAGLFKIKPRHSLDVAVLGFCEGVDDRVGLLHDMLIGVMRQDGTLHVLGRVGGGFTDEQRASLLSDLKDLACDSDYTEVNSDHVAYQMVRPELIVEISCLDLVSHGTRGQTVDCMVLQYDAARQKYDAIRRLPLASIISPQFVRVRDDKTLNLHDVRIKQVADVVEIALLDRDARQIARPASEVLRREVFVKTLKGRQMVRKLMLWKTNKDDGDGVYPAYVAYLTDFSPNRKTPLEREIRVSSSREQIELLYADLKAENTGKGWDAFTA